MIGQNKDHLGDFYCLLSNRGNSSNSSAFQTLNSTSLDTGIHIPEKIIKLIRT